MTSYSITNHRPGAPADEQREADIETFVFGACRAILDTAEATEQPYPDIETKTTEAVWWHGPGLGWEWEAIHPDDRSALDTTLGAWAEAHYDELAALDFTARGGAQPEHWYDAGYLLIFTVRGEGIGLWECGEAGKALSDPIHAMSTKAYIEAFEADDKVHVTLTLEA